MTEEITQTDVARTKASQDSGPKSSPKPATIDNKSLENPPNKTSRIITGKPPETSPDMSLQRPSEQQTLTTQSASEKVSAKASKPANPLEMPYEGTPDSKEYKDWRQAQHRHGMRNLIFALLVFGSLAVLYWVYIHNVYNG